jgi:pimeloyl-ACP methyl ester carboxylesterase
MMPLQKQAGAGIRIGAAATVAFILCGFLGCTPVASVKQTSVCYHGSGNKKGELAAAEKLLSEASRIERRQPTIALASDLSAAKIAANRLGRDSSNKDAQKLYNFAIARSIENVQRANLEPWRHPVNVSGLDGDFVLVTLRPVDSQHNPSNYTLYPSDSLKLGGKFFRNRVRVEGIGAPLVAVGRTQNTEFRERYEGPRVYAPVTAVLRFKDRCASLEFHEPFLKERVIVANRSFALASDFDAPMAMLLRRERPDKLGFARLMRPEKYADTARLIRLQPFDPRRTPVIFVHGLQDTPVSWVPMISALRKDVQIQRRYQLWVFSYPSGYPYPYSAALLRHELDGIARKFPGRKKVVLVGHSMGGMICRLMITDAGDKIWRNIFGKSPGETPLNRRSRDLLQDAIVFNHRADVKRVIFISTPHRGALLASNWIGRTAARLIKTPAFLADVRDSAVSLVADDVAARQLNRVPNSIDTLSPDDRFVRWVNELPLASGLPYHSIIGDRGKGDTPNSSDGVVAYWSSHLDGAKSELIVPANHIAQRNRETIAEVERILKTSP